MSLPPLYRDEPETPFDQEASVLSALLIDINNGLALLDKAVSVLARHPTASSDTSRATQLTTRLLDQFKELATKSQALRLLVDHPTTSQLYTVNKLQAETQRLLATFSQLQLQFRDANAAMASAAKAALEEETMLGSAEAGLSEAGSSGPEASAQLVIEHTPINAEELEYQQNLIAQREREIASIQLGIEELNGIFQDIGQMVVEQGTVVDTIEGNLYLVAANTRTAGAELNRALRYQRRSGGRLCCLLMILVLVLLVVVLAMLV